MICSSLPYIPSWLKGQLGNREESILYHPSAKVVTVDADGNKIAEGLFWIESDVGRFQINSVTQEIVN